MTAQAQSPLVVPDRLRLDLVLDCAAIGSEAVALAPAAWIPHFNKAVHAGEWSGATLRGPGGDAQQIYPDPTGHVPVADTPLLQHCPATAAALTTFDCPVLIARFLALGPGSLLRPHHDEGLGFSAGTIRLHMPLVSDPGVEFVLDDAAVTMKPGECWYLDLRRTHSAENRSGQRRIHLVVDCTVNDWLRRVFARSLDGAARNE